MPSLSDSRTLGGAGSILVLLTPIPYVGWALGIAGLVMTLIAVKSISDSMRDEKIFNDMLISVILIIAGIVVGTVVVLGAVYRVLGMGSIVGSTFVPASNITTGDWVGLAAAVIGGVAVVWAILVASAYFLRRSYNSIATKLNISTFRTAGLLYLIGAATTIVAVGFLILLVAQIMLAVAFFSINDTTAVQVTKSGQSLSQSGGPVG